MSLFGKKDNQKPVGTIEMPIVAHVEPVSYDSALEYLLGLSDKDFEKFNKVVGINRTANKETARVLGIKQQPTTFLKEEVEYDEPVQARADTNSDESSFLDDDLETAFLDDDEKIARQKAAAKPKPNQPVSS